MKLTIIPSDKAVYKDTISFLNLTFDAPNDVNALQWDSEMNVGWIEFVTSFDGTTPQNQNITELPAWAVEASAVWDQADYENKNPPPPTDAELIQACQIQAEQYLQQTDWSEIPSVVDTTSPTYLVNSQEFVQYRIQVRALRLNPVTNPVFPTMPSPQWSN